VKLSGRIFVLLFLACIVTAGVEVPTACAAAPDDGSVLPFPPTASVAGATLQDSTMTWRQEPQRLQPDAPNILIVLIDDVGFGIAETFGGEIHTPTLSRLANDGLSYNRFHTTSICSPTRAALLTGRNHHRVGNGTIAERASDFDGYTGIIPTTSATIAEALHHYGYKSSAFGKWHNTPANQTTTMGPFDRWPTGHGFDYFYGFNQGETHQYYPTLYRNTTPVPQPNGAVGAVQHRRRFQRGRRSRRDASGQAQGAAGHVRRGSQEIPGVSARFTSLGAPGSEAAVHR
jgi:arylsulfatase